MKIKTLKQLRRFCSSDETRMAICGVYYDPKKGVLVATDGRRMAIWSGEIGINSEESFIIPARLIDLAPDDSGEVDVLLTGKSVTIKTNDVVITCPVIESKFPTAWENIAPNPWPEKYDLRRLPANIAWLHEMCEVVTQLDGERGYVVTSHGEDDSVICIKSPRFTGFQMPIRGGDEYGKPDWLQSPPAAGKPGIAQEAT